MDVFIIDSCQGALQIHVQDVIISALSKGGHRVYTYPTTHALHHDSLRLGLERLERSNGEQDWTSDCLAIVESDCYVDPAWLHELESDLTSSRDNQTKAAIGAHHGWRKFDAHKDDVVRHGRAPWRGTHEPLDDNLAGWFCVLHRRRLAAAGVRLADLDWRPKGFRVLLDAAGKAIGAEGGDTGGRVAGQVRAVGLDVEFLPVEPSEFGFGSYVASEAGRRGAWHSFYGRQIGRVGEIDVGHHKLRAEDVTDGVLDFLEHGKEKLG